MKFKTFSAVSVAFLLVQGVACTDVLTEPKSTVTGANVFNDPGSYRAFLAKIYVGLSATGQQGGAGRPDIQGIDEGFSQYVRLVWQMNELPTEEAIIAWNDTGVQELNTQIWGTSNQFLQAMYYRIYFQVAMANEFLRETTDEKLAERGATDAVKAQVKTYRAEARFLRALSYWHGIDLFGAIPLVVETDPIGSTPPAQATRTEVFNFIESELKTIQPELPSRAQQEYGRASSSAAAMLLAKLYMNAQVYTGTARYADARAAVEQVIAGGYTLAPIYRNNFLADNNTSPELIFTVPQDGKKTQSYGGMTFLVHARGRRQHERVDVWNRRRMVGPSPQAGSCPATDQWICRRQTRAGVHRRPDASDQRHAQLSARLLRRPKYANVTSTGAAGFGCHIPGHRLPDVPSRRCVPDVCRSGASQRRRDQAQALTYINALRTRAYGNASANITDAAADAQLHQGRAAS